MWNINLKGNKKGNILDIPESMFIILGVVFTVFIVGFILANFQSKIAANSTTNIESVVNTFSNMNAALYLAIDVGIMIIFITFPFVSFLLAKKIPADPITGFIAVIIIPVIIIIGMVLSNLYGGMMETAQFADFITGNFYIIPYIMQYLGIYAVIYSGFVLVGLYSKQ